MTASTLGLFSVPTDATATDVVTYLRGERSSRNAACVATHYATINGATLTDAFGGAKATASQYRNAGDLMVRIGAKGTDAHFAAAFAVGAFAATARKPFDGLKGAALGAALVKADTAHRLARAASNAKRKGAKPNAQGEAKAKAEAKADAKATTNTTRIMVALAALQAVSPTEPLTEANLASLATISAVVADLSRPRAGVTPAPAKAKAKATA